MWVGIPPTPPYPSVAQEVERPPEEREVVISKMTGGARTNMDRLIRFYPPYTSVVQGIGHGSSKTTMRVQVLPGVPKYYKYLAQII